MVEEESPEDFRGRVGAWLGEHAPRRSPQAWAGARSVTREQVAAAKRFQARLFEAGLAGLRWPRVYGGQGLSLAHEVAFAEAATPFDLPTGFVFSITFGMCGPTILAHGTERQRRSTTTRATSSPWGRQASPRSELPCSTCRP